jgi:hypothetical protein
MFDKLRVLEAPSHGPDDMSSANLNACTSLMPDGQFAQLYLVHAIKPVSLWNRLDSLKKSMAEFLPFDIFGAEVIVVWNFSE